MVTQAGEFETIQVEVADGVRVVRLNRPDKLNAINPKMLEEIVASLEAARMDQWVGAVVVTGNDRAFSVGADVDAFANTTPDDLTTIRSDFHLWESIRRFPKPLIAAVSGYVYGGGFELALACDMIVASETARFASPEIRLGLIPGAGGTQHLVRRLGKYLAMEVVLAGRELTAQEALQYGLVNHVTPSGEQLKKAVAIARRIASFSPAAVRVAKMALLRGADMPWDGAVAFERELFHEVFATPAAQEAIRSFLEERRRRKGSS